MDKVHNFELNGLKYIEIYINLLYFFALELLHFRKPFVFLCSYFEDYSRP